MSRPGRRTPASGRRPSARLSATTVVAAAAALLCCFPSLVGFNGVTPFVQIVAWRVPLVVVLGPLVLVAGVLALRRPRRFWRSWVGPPWAVLACVLVVAAATLVPRALASLDSTPTGRPFQVLTLNVDNGDADVAQLATLVDFERPDVVVLPEAGRRFSQALATALSALRYRPAVAGPADLPDGMTTAVLVAPGVEEDRYEHDGTRFWWMRMAGGNLPVDLFAVHIAAPVPGQAWKWREDLAALAGLCASGRPVLVVGDFNSTVDNHRFDQMADGCVDAASAVGKGLTGTWPAWAPPLLGMQIDHVLVGRDIGVEAVDVRTVAGTDHRAVLATLRVPTTSPAPAPDLPGWRRR